MIPSSHPLVFLRLLLLVIPPESEGEAPAGVRPPVPSLAMQEQRARRPLENPQRSHRSDPLVLPGRSLLCWAFCVKTLPARASQRHVKRQGAWSVDCKVQILGVVVFSSGLGLAEALARLFLMVKLAHLWPCYCLSTHFLIVLFFLSLSLSCNIIAGERVWSAEHAVTPSPFTGPQRWPWTEAASHVEICVMQTKWLRSSCYSSQFLHFHYRATSLHECC